ncbi:MAG: hypothetical protein WB767_16230 [Nocardioides sp.]
MDGHDLVGMISQADIARKMPARRDDRRPGRGHLVGP